jgi:hypothetical protein
MNDRDQYLSSIGDRAVALAADAPPYWLDVAAQSVLVNAELALVPEPDLARPGPDAHSLAYTAARLGINARRAECQAIGLPEEENWLRDLLERNHDRSGGSDWFRTVCVTAAGLVRIAEEDRGMSPSGLGQEMYLRLGELIVQAMLSDASAAGRQLGTVTTATVFRCWHFGYYLSACNGSLPVPATAELSRAQP